MARELIALAVIAACSREPSARPDVSAPPLAGKPFYRVDRGAQLPCASGTTCEAALVLTALGDFHVNKDYPFKFVGDPGTAVQVDGPGSFALDGTSHGTLTIKFRPTQPGTAKLAGAFKLSVCSDQTCEIESPRLELAIPVS